MYRALLLIVLTALCGSAFAATILVPADQPTIQAGINAAADFDTVLVAPGTYTGAGNRDIEFFGKHIVIRSTSGAATTVIDCQGTASDRHRAFYLHANEDSLSVIRGFTITGAYDSIAAVYCYGGGMKLSHCIIADNSCAGIRFEGVPHPANWLRLDSCMVSNNSGDGAYVVYAFDIYGSAFSHNLGRGLWCQNPSNNSEVTGSLFANNGLAGMGGQSFAGEMAWVKNCTFVGNSDGLTSILDLPYGRAAAWGPKVENCLFAYNRHYGYNSGGYVQPVATCCDAFGNGTNWVRPNYPPEVADTLGNFSGNPLFCDSATGNFKLMNASPCLAANNSCATLIGAFDFGCICCRGVTADVNLSGGVNLADMSALVSYLTGGGYSVLCVAEANVNGTGSVDLADLSALANFLTVGGYVLPSCP